MPRLYLVQFEPRVNQPVFNTWRIMKKMSEANKKGASLIVFGETSITGYKVRQSLVSQRFFDVIEACLDYIRKYADHLKIGIILGTYRRNNSDGKLAKNGVWTYFPWGVDGLDFEDSYQEKVLIPRQPPELDEVLYVAAGNSDTMGVRTIGNKRVVYHICQDSWRTSKTETYLEDPWKKVRELNADVLINVSASPWYEGKWYGILQDMLKFSADHQITIIYLPIAGFEDQQFQLTAGGFVVHCGRIKRLLPRFVEAEIMVDLETIANEPDLDFDVSLRHHPQHKQHIKIESIYHAFAAVIHSLCIQYGFAQGALLDTKNDFEITPFLPQAAETLNTIRLFYHKHTKYGFALEFNNPINVFLIIHLLRNHASSDAKIVLGLYDITDLTCKQKDFLKNIE